MRGMWYFSAIFHKIFPGSALPDNAMTEQQKIHLLRLYAAGWPDVKKDKSRFCRRLHGVKKVKNLMPNRPFCAGDGARN